MNKWLSAKSLEKGEASTATVPALKVPRKYVIWLINDDFTPMDFVVLILKKFFLLTEPKATQVMLQIHVLGKAVCGTFTRDVAETMVVQVNDFSKENGHPLLCAMEPE